MKLTKMFFILLLTLIGVMGVKASQQLELTPNNGTYATSSSNFVSTLTFSTDPVVTVTASANNMDRRQTSGYFSWYSGTAQSGTYTIATSDTYLITGYTITAQANSNDQTVTAGGTSTTFTSSGETTMSVTGLNGSATTFTLSGSNTGLKVSKIVLTIEENNSYEAPSSYVCTINNTNTSRGALMYAPTKSTKWVWSSGKESQTFDATSANCQWVFVETGVEEEYYLYNLGIGKFIIPVTGGTYNGLAWAFSNDAVALKLLAQSDGTYKIKTVNNDVYVSVSNSYTGPIINYNDIGGNFTITKVADLTSGITQQTTAAVNKLIHNTTKLSSVPTTEGWYAIRIKSHVSYADQFVFTAKDEITYGSTKYPLDFFSAFKLRPAIDNSIYYAKLTKTSYGHYWQLPNGRFIQNGKPISGVGESSVTGISYDATNGFTIKSSSYYFVPYLLSGAYFIGETSDNSGNNLTYYDIYPINLTDAGLTAWKVIITGATDATQLTCTRADVSGLASVYNNGYFFLPSGETPANSEFTLEGMVSCTVDANAKTITAQYDPSIGLMTDNVVVTQGYQTTGQGNENALLLRMDVTSLQNLTNTTLTVTLDETTQQNISSLYVYETTATEFIANIPSTKLATADAISGTVSLNLGSVSSGLHHYWLCATVKSDATLGDILDAALTTITYTTTDNKTLDVSAIGNPSRQGMKVFAKQNFVFKPTTDNCKYYRIPAMILDKEGNIVVAIDRRYNSNADLGNHKIDVSVVRSTDDGNTWSSQNIVAIGNTSVEARYGYGDAALARTQSGKLICLMAPGQNNFFGTDHSGSLHYNNWVAMLTSDDNGVTWQGASDNPTQPILLTSDVFGMGNNHSIFVSSGKGLTTADGTVMFTTNVRMPDGTLNCYILKTTDEGATWTLGSEVAYSGTDESKLEQLSDDRLILSVRQSGDRGWNFGGSDGTGWGTQYRTSDIWGNACNADIINYGREMSLGKDVLIHSYINSSGRESLQLAISLDGGSSWKNVYNIQPNGSCYSTMQVLSDGTLAILYEDESYSAGNGYAINYVTITKDQVEAWIEELDQAEYDFDANFDKTFIIKNYYAADGNKRYIRSVKYNDANDLNVYRTADINESAEMIILKDHQNEGFYFVYDTKSNYYLKGSTITNSGAVWTFSTTPVTVKLIDDTSNHNWSLTDGHIFLIENSQGSMANAYEGVYGDQVKNWTDGNDAGSHWYIYATENSTTSAVYIDPTALYYVKNADNGCCFETGEDGDLTRNTQATAATYAIIPVSGQEGFFYLYDTQAHNFVVSEEDTGDGGQWTRSTTTPTAIKIKNNITNQYMDRSQWNPSTIIYLLGSKYANRYGGGMTGLVRNYNAQADKGSHWYLERVDNSSSAIVEMNVITENIQSLVTSGVEAGTQLQYTTNLNVVGDASWATLYLPYFDILGNDNTMAYYVPSVSDDTAQLEEIQGGNVPAGTAVVLSNSSAATEVTFSVTKDLPIVIDSEDNLLKGTDESISLDLSSNSPYYSLGRSNGNIGFYKFKAADGTTTITLGANKAYLQIPVSTSNSVKGFRIVYAGDDSIVSDDGGFVDGISEVQVDGKNEFYNLNGMRVNTLRKGIYIVNSKKMVVN